MKEGRVQWSLGFIFTSPPYTLKDFIIDSIKFGLALVLLSALFFLHLLGLFQFLETQLKIRRVLNNNLAQKTITTKDFFLLKNGNLHHGNRVKSK